MGKRQPGCLRRRQCRAWGNGRSTCDALRRGMRKVCLDDRFGQPGAILHSRFSGMGRPAEALCTQPVIDVEGRSALRTPTFAKRPSWVTYSESKLDPSRSVPGLGTKPPDFYGDETWKSQTVLTLSPPAALVINVPGVRFPRCLPESKAASERLRRGSLSSPYTFLSAGYPSETSSVAPLRFSMRGAQVHHARLRDDAGRSASSMSSITQRVRARRRPHQVVLHRNQAHIDQISMPNVFTFESLPKLVFGACRLQKCTSQLRPPAHNSRLGRGQDCTCRTWHLHATTGTHRESLTDSPLDACDTAPARPSRYVTIVYQGYPRNW